MENSTFLIGENIILRPLMEDDILGNYQNWLNNPDIVAYNSHGRFPLTVGDLRHYLTKVASSDSVIVLAIVFRPSGSHIGNISLQNINWVDRSVEIAFLLGEKDFWGKGIMHEAGSLLLNHAFETLNLNRVFCGTSSENVGMQKLAQKLGFELEGRRRECFFKHGRYIDILEYGLLKKEWCLLNKI